MFFWIDSAGKTNKQTKHILENKNYLKIKIFMGIIVQTIFWEGTAYLFWWATGNSP